MKRRYSNQSDSLDLLLDTLCNLFGLIILITILIALLVQISGQETMKEIKSITSVYKNNQKELGYLTDTKTFLSREIKTINTADLLQLVAIASEASRILESARKELARRRILLAQEQMLISKEVDFVQQLKDQLPLLWDEIEMLEEELRREESLKDIKLRTPKRREVTDLLPVQVVLKDNRAYIINNTTGWKNSPNPRAKRCHFWTTWNSKAVDENRSEWFPHKDCLGVGGQDIERTIYLLPSGGIPIPTDTSIDNNQDWLYFLDTLHPKIHVISLKVDPDSFEAFGEVRRSITNAEFHYDVDPKLITEPYRDRIKDDHSATTM